MHVIIVFKFKTNPQKKRKKCNKMELMQAAVQQAVHPSVLPPANNYAPPPVQPLLSEDIKVNRC